jgi:hypothetical protein
LDAEQQAIVKEEAARSRAVLGQASLLWAQQDQASLRDRAELLRQADLAEVGTICFCLGLNTSTTY